MRVLKAIFISVLFVTQVNAETNHWQVIKQYLTTSTPEGGAQGKKFLEYLESLSPNELIIAGRQCSAEMEASISPENWDVAIGNLGFFFEESYPYKADNFKNIPPLLNDLQDRTQSIFWRRALMHELGSRSDKLSSEQRLNAAKIMYKIYSDDSESLLLKPKAIEKSTRLLKHAYSINLRNDPNVKEFTKQQKIRTPELINAIQTGKVKLSQQTINANEEVLNEINQSIATQLSLFSNKQVGTGLKTSIIVSLARYHKYNLDSPQVSQTLANAINDYKDYDEKLWYLLVKTNIEDFNNQNAATKLQDMINNAQDETVKNNLIRLNKNVRKILDATTTSNLN